MIQLVDGLCKITSIQMICHETKIPTFVEIHVGCPQNGDENLDPSTFIFHSLGFYNYFSFFFLSLKLFISYTISVGLRLMTMKKAIMKQTN